MRNTRLLVSIIHINLVSKKKKKKELDLPLFPYCKK